LPLPDTIEPSNSFRGAPLRHASTGEILLVLGIPIGLFFGFSLLSIFYGPAPTVFNDARFLRTLLVEIALAAALLPYLARRGWSPRLAAGAPKPLDLLRGIGMWLLCMAALALCFATVRALAPAVADSLQKPHFTGAPSGWIIAATSIINPLFEEFLWLAYEVPAVSSRLGIRSACVISVAIRVAVHTYQGPLALVSILPMGVVLTAYFARSGRLWPVIVAHIIADALGLMAVAIRH
jgi:membrane protease YdiL (CAAX protease family)